MPQKEPYGALPNTVSSGSVGLNDAEFFGELSKLKPYKPDKPVTVGSYSTFGSAGQAEVGHSFFGLYQSSKPSVEASGTHRFSPVDYERYNFNHQGTGDFIMNGFLGAAAGTVYTVTEQIPAMILNKFSLLSDETFARIQKENMNHIQHIAPMYQNPDAEGITAGGLYATTMQSAVPFFASAYVTGLAAGKVIGGLSLSQKALSLVPEVKTMLESGKLAELSLPERILTSKLATAPRLVATVVNGITEAAFEQSQAYSTTKEKLYGDWLHGKNNLSPGEQENKAKEVGKNVFYANLPLLFLSDYQYGSMFKSFNNSRRLVQGLEKGIKTTRGINIFNATVGALEGILKEGGQELIQQGIQDSAFNNRDKNLGILGTTLNVLTTTWEHMGDREYVESFISGALLGGVMGAFNGYGKRADMVSNINILRDNYINNTGKFLEGLSWEKDANGNPRIPSIDKQKGENVIYQYSNFIKLQALKNLAAAQNNKEAFEHFNNLQFSRLAFAKFSMGRGAEFEKELRDLGQSKKEDWADMNIFEFDTNEDGSEKTPQQISDEYVKKGTKLEDIFNTMKALGLGEEFSNPAMRLAYEEKVFSLMTEQHFLGEQNRKLSNNILKEKGNLSEISIKDQATLLQAKIYK